LRTRAFPNGQYFLKRLRELYGKEKRIERQELAIKRLEHMVVL